MEESPELVAVPGFGFFPVEVASLTAALFQDHIQRLKVDVDSLQIEALDELKCKLVVEPDWRFLFPALGGLPEQAVCPPTWDGASCIPPTLAGHTAVLPCMASFDSNSYSPDFNSTKSCLGNGSWSGLTDYHDCMCWGSDQHVNHSICTSDDDNVQHNYHIYIHLVGYILSFLALVFALGVYLSLREMRCLRHKIHMGLFCAFGLSALNWILTLSWRNLVRQDLAEPLLCTTFTLTYFFHLTSFYWMFLEGFYLFLQVQYPLSLVSVKYKHFLLFGLGGPILNTLIWFALRLADRGAQTSSLLSNQTTHMVDGLEDDMDYLEDGHVACLFMEDKPLDQVMKLPMVGILIFNTFFLIWIISIVITKLRQRTAMDHDRRHWKAAKALIFVMPLLGVGHILNLVVKPTVASIGIPLVVMVADFVEAVIMSSQGFVISLPYCFLNSELQSVVRNHWKRWRMVRTVGRDTGLSRNSLGASSTYFNQKTIVQV